MCQVTYNLYPEIEPFETNWLKVGDIHNVYYELCGNPEGAPVIFLHGGPGSGCNPGQRRFFDPGHYRIILIDQRGCGRSKPQGEVEENTTEDLIADLERLREHLGIAKWHVFGGSWGSTLALAYAIKHMNRVTTLILRGIFLSRPNELDWFLGEVKLFFPEVWQTLLDYLPENERNNLLIAYEKRIFSADAKINQAAAERWNAFEGSILRLIPLNANNTAANNVNSSTIASDTEVARARVQIHYIQQHCFVDGEAILKQVAKLSHIPTIIVQGRYDMVCPPETAWLLSRSMPHAELIMVPDAGHSAMETGIMSALVAATEKFKQIG
ncbi:MAG: prolyl aminopeptidase [Methylophilaceae bacterium]